MNSKIPMRRCVGCMESKAKETLMRVAYYEHVLTVDADGRAKGRGLYLCKNPDCIAAAKKKRAFNRGFKCNIAQDQLDAAFAELEAAVNER